ncbi:TRAP transporter small permease subunit [Bisbaumannia pacifica]|uniref:TRAP transporter small permease protein n=1 Tax=Bisbaumannia pacifica TaxID=77098 RepID=A0A510XA26_9GAMM|nr:TRAP transporter small permease subunit [Halomonas pacifica]MBH8580157.1 TRAP transporter small permease subunit [Halomonas pacifica]GEK48298.1 hypothetical protein HPA02_25810 [Halomonas pacifica]
MILNLIDKISWLSAWVSKALLIVLTGAMLYEVVARYAFNASTIWAFDISYMVTGAVFLLGVAWTAREDGHVRVDVVSNLMPKHISATINGVAYMMLMCPIVSLMAWHGWKKSWKAFVTGEVDMVSIWAPKMWPFYGIIAVGLTLLALQLFAQGVRYFIDKNTLGEKG